MKFLLFLVLPCLLQAKPQSGFFSGITNAVNNFFGGNRGNGQSGNRPPPPQRRPPPPQNQQQFQPQNSFQPQPPRQTFPSQSSSFNAPSSSFNSQPSFTETRPSNPAPSTFSRPSSSFSSSSSSGSSFSSSGSSFPSSSGPSQQLVRGNSNTFSTNSVSKPSVDFVNGCSTSNNAPNYVNNGIGYVVTWKFGESCSKFTQSEAKQFCEAIGMEPVSLNTPAKQDTFNRLIAQDAQRYFWTGGEIAHSNQRICWNNKNAACISFSDSAHWSNTGGAGVPQPDNRAAGETPPSPEVCLAILNNFYADGIKWHDVACHHRKPTVCEPRQ